MTKRERICAAAADAASGRPDEAIAMARSMMLGTFYRLGGEHVILTCAEAKGLFVAAGMAPDDFDAIMAEGEVLHG